MTPQRIAQIKREIAAGTYDLLPGTCPLGCVEFTAERLAQEIETMGIDVLQIDDVVQVIAPVGRFASCFLVVTEIKSWGIVGYARAPGIPGTIPYRCETSQFVRIGKAKVVEMEEGDNG